MISIMQCTDTDLWSDVTIHLFCFGARIDLWSDLTIHLFCYGARIEFLSFLFDLPTQIYFIVAKLQNGKYLSQSTNFY